MEEYALIFFLLIQESLRLDGNEYLNLAEISILPHLKKKEAQDVIRKYENMVQPQEAQIDVTRDRDRLRKLLQGKTILK